MRASENQGSREVCVAAQGGGTWEALYDSSHGEIIDTLTERLDEDSMEN